MILKISFLQHINHKLLALKINHTLIYTQNL